MKALLTSVFILFSLSNLRAQIDNSPLGIRNIEIYHIMKHITHGPYVRTNSQFEFKFQINEQGEPSYLRITPSISDSLSKINSMELEQLKFTGHENIEVLTLKIFSHYTTTGKRGDDQVFDLFDKEKDRFKNVDGRIANYIENGSEIELRPFLYITLACGSGSSYADDIMELESPLKIKMPRKLKFPGL